MPAAQLLQLSPTHHAFVHPQVKTKALVSALAAMGVQEGEKVGAGRMRASQLWAAVALEQQQWLEVGRVGMGQPFRAGDCSIYPSTEGLPCCLRCCMLTRTRVSNCSSRRCC